MAAAAEQRKGERTVIGRVPPGEALPIPFGWRAAGKQLQVQGPQAHSIGHGAASAWYTMLDP